MSDTAALIEEARLWAAPTMHNNYVDIQRDVLGRLADALEASEAQRQELERELRCQRRS